VSLVHSGEWSGNLAGTLKTLAKYLERAQANCDAISAALTYPIILLITAGLSITFLLLFVLPEFRSVFEGAGAKLPLATRILINLGDFLRNYWSAIVFGALIVPLAGREALKDPKIRMRRDRLLLSIPIFGELILKLECERFCRTLGVLLQGGVDLPAALPLARATFANSVLSRSVSEATDRLREGESLASQLEATRTFPRATTQMIQVGEATGTLDAMLIHHADLLEQTAKHTTDRLLAILTPALTLALGLLVGGLIASMLVAILSINDLAL
jgi:general secretion pathway protein F